MFPVGVYNVEDYPLNWISGTYYSTYKGNTFQVSSIENVKSEAQYNAVTTIDLRNQTLTTNFTGTLLNKFDNLSALYCFGNQITILDASQLTSLTILYCYNNQLTALDVSQLVNLNNLQCYNNQITALDVSQLVDLTVLRCELNQISILDVSQLVDLNFLFCDNNQISTLDVSQLVNLNNLQCQSNQLDAATNSQILIDLDANGLSNGYLQSSIFGGGSLTTAGQTAKTNLLSKGWTIVGI